MSSYRKQLIDLIQRQGIAKTDIDNALHATEVYPAKHAWTNLFSDLLLWLGVIALAASLVFFFAYNWDAMGRYAKFGLAEAAIVLAICCYYKFAHKPIVTNATLTLAALMLGALLALYGQTYQTGADPWQLFFNWSILILPLAFIAQSAALWLLCLVLVNLAIALYHHAFRGAMHLLLSSNEAALWIHFCVNIAAFILWEFSALRCQWLAVSWARRCIALSCSALITWMCILAIASHEIGTEAAIVWIIFCGFLYVVYRRLKPDLFMLATGCLSGIMVITTFLGKSLLGHNTDAGGFLLLALIVIGMGTGAAVWLKNISRELAA